jgi:hypothetical protein
MQLKKYEIKSHVTKEMHQLVLKEAVARKATMSKIIRDCLTEYFLLREELANSIESPGEVGGPHTGRIIHTLLSRNEQRWSLLIEQLEKQIILVQEQMQLLITMIDQFYLSQMQFLPDIPKEMLEVSIILAKRRHKNWLAEIKNILDTQ